MLCNGGQACLDLLPSEDDLIYVILFRIFPFCVGELCNEINLQNKRLELEPSQNASYISAWYLLVMKNW